MTAHALDLSTIQNLISDKVLEVVNEPDFSWQGSFRSFLTANTGEPVVRAKMINCHLDTDIWEGLRSPARVGMYPLTFEDLWTHYAAMNLKNTRPDGSPDPMAVPETYGSAQARYKRAVIICGMLALNPEIHQRYSQKIMAGDEDPFDYYGRSIGEVISIIDKALTKTALALMQPGRAVIPMNAANVERIVARTRCDYHTGDYHGPCNDHWPQNSIAVLTGLLKFGISRLPFRDEIGEDGKVQRLFGKYRSIVIFDEEQPQTGGEGGLGFLDTAGLNQLIAENDYRHATADAAGSRYCTYNLQKRDGSSGCAKCIAVCPSGALKNSSPGPDGVFPASVAEQKHRFKEDFLDFDHGNCFRERNRKMQIYEEYVCARCESICATHGIRKPAAEIRRINGAT